MKFLLCLYLVFKTSLSQFGKIFKAKQCFKNREVKYKIVIRSIKVSTNMNTEIFRDLKG